MGERVDIGGHPTWVDVRGSGDETVLLLHGGLSFSDRLLSAFGEAFAERYRLVAFDRRGHGCTADTPEPFHYEDMAAEAIAVLEEVVGGRAHLVGWSDGGIVALFVAIRRPDLVDRLVLIGTNFHHEGLGHYDVDADSAVGLRIGAAYAERSPDGAEHFAEMLAKSMVLAHTEPALTVADLATVAAPALVMAGDDEFISLGHTCELYEALPNGQLSIVPGASHGLPLERPGEVARIALAFLAAELPPATMMPVRRAPAAP